MKWAIRMVHPDGERTLLPTRYGTEAEAVSALRRHRASRPPANRRAEFVLVSVRSRTERLEWDRDVARGKVRQYEQLLEERDRQLLDARKERDAAQRCLRIADQDAEARALPLRQALANATRVISLKDGALAALGSQIDSLTICAKPADERAARAQLIRVTEAIFALLDVALEVREPAPTLTLSLAVDELRDAVLQLLDPREDFPGASALRVAEVVLDERYTPALAQVRYALSATGEDEA